MIKKPLLVVLTILVLTVGIAALPSISQDQYIPKTPAQVWAEASGLQPGELLVLEGEEYGGIKPVRG